MPLASFVVAASAFASSVFGAPFALTQPVSASQVPTDGVGDFIPLGAGVEGDQPMDVVIALSGSVAVVALRDTDSLEFYDTASGVRLGAVQVPDSPVDLDATPDGTLVFVACQGAGRVVVVDVASRAVVTSIGVTGGVYQVEVLSDGNRAVVASDAPGGVGRLSVVDRTMGSVIVNAPTVQLTPLVRTSSPETGVSLLRRAEFAVTPDDLYVVQPGYQCQCIQVHDIATLSVVANFSGLATRPVGASAAPDSSFVAVGGSSDFVSGSSWLYIVDFPGVLLREVPIPGTGGRNDVAVTPNSQSVLFGQSARLLRVEAVSGQITGSSPTLADQGEIEITDTGAYAIVTSPGGAVVNLATMTPAGFAPIDSGARLAMLPGVDRAIAVFPFANESILRFSVGAPFSAIDWETELGVPVELDAPYDVALTADERLAAVTCPTSQNLAIVETDSGVISSTVDLGGAGFEVSVSPTDDIALVALKNQGEVVSVELATGQVLSRIALGGQVISVSFRPDGARAVAVSVAFGSSEVISLDAAGGILSQTGSWMQSGQFWTEAHLSPDGTRLAGMTFGSATIVDVDNLAIVTSVICPSIATYGSWSADSSRFGWSANVIDTWVVTLGGAAGPIVDVFTAPNIVTSRAFGPDGVYLYQFLLDDTIRVLEFGSDAVVANVALPGSPTFQFQLFPRWMEVVGGQLLAVRTEAAGTVYRLSMAGPATALLGTVTFASEGASGIAFSHGTGRMFLPATTTGDGLRVVDYGGSWESVCGPAVTNSTGGSASLSVRGPLLAGDVSFDLSATDLPPMSFGLFVASRSPGTAMPPGSQGRLCLGGSIGRFLDSIQGSGAAGRLSYEVDPTALPLATGMAALPGESIYFQLWFRDANPSATSNFSDAARVEFR